VNNAQRALQIWQVLIGAAHNRQTLTYAQIGELIGLPAQGLGRPLEGVYQHCRAQGLPPLTVLVVSAHTGHPAGGYEPVKEEGADRESVYEYGWYSLEPRQASDFQERQEQDAAEG